MTRVIVVGCGIVGAAIAYELSQFSNISVTVIDQQQPAQASTGAALGVLMGAISQKTKGGNLRMRLDSIQRYNQWIPELEATTGHRILFNQQGILRLCFAGEDLNNWQNLAAIRQKQGWTLELCDRAQLSSQYPQLNLERVIGAVYSPQDRQVDPTGLTLALVAASEQKGVHFRFGEAVIGAEVLPNLDDGEKQCHAIYTDRDRLSADWLVVAAGLGSTPLTAHLHQPIDLRPVLGQAVQVKLAHPLGDPNHQPVITGEDTHIVPLGKGEYWVGATVEFQPSDSEPKPDTNALKEVMDRAIALCPALKDAAIHHTWSGLRPRPEGRPAPIIEKLSGYQNVLSATGHYRNGVLLAPATAAKIRQFIIPE